MKKTRVFAFGVVIALGVAFGAGLYTGISEKNSSTVSAAEVPTVTIDLGNNQPKNVDFAQFWKAWNILNQNFVQTHASDTLPTDEEKIYGAIAGLTNSYGDPYTVFLPPSDAEIFNADVNGSFGGVGMELGVNAKNQLVVVAPLKGSPAERAGIRSGDIVTMIGTTSSETMRVDEAVKLIRGKKGTIVKLTLKREGAAQPIVVSIERDTIEVPVIDTQMRADGIFVISLYSFSANSSNLFRGALREFFESGSTKLILDLRGNPGGYLGSAVEMASFFLPVGKAVVTEDFKGKQENIVQRSVGYNVFANKQLTMAILTDQGSASASEILAGALQQHGIAKLVGDRTFGKGSVQQLIDLGGGAELKVTIARWLTPNGTSISDGGLTPDIKAARTADDVKAGKDPQMEAAVLLLTN